MFVLIGCLILGYWMHHNYFYVEKFMKKVWQVGFQEKNVALKDGSVIHYIVGGQGEALLLIHGQGVSSRDYMEVLPRLKKKYKVYAVDCYGHGKSSKDSNLYTIEKIGKDLSWFIQHVIKEPVVLSGHSSGGLIAIWISSHCPEYVKALILEDPPLFSSEKGRDELTFAYHDMFKHLPAYTGDEDYVLFYLKHCQWLKYFGKGRQGIIKYSEQYRLKHSSSSIKYFFLPPKVTRMLSFLDEYDPKFGMAFYDGSWMAFENHEMLLRKVSCQTLLIHTSWKYDDAGILLAAMDEEDAKRGLSLLENGQMFSVASGHDFHGEKPRAFLKCVNEFMKTLP